jgi:ribosomal-protein-alanine N-acetyltransferase
MMIETARLLLRPMRSGDADELLRVFGDPKVMAAFEHEPFGQAEMARWVERNLTHQQHYGYGLFSVIHKAERRIIGDCGFEHRNIQGRAEVELGYDFCSDYWGQGLATEAAAAVRDHAFADLKLARLVSLIRKGNTASRRVSEKIGMRHVTDLIENGVGYALYAVDNPQGLH